MNNLYIQKSKNFPNGIKVDTKYKGFKNKIGEDLSIFLVKCYIIKRIKKSKPNGEVFIYLTPVNTILDTINNKSDCLKEIDIIFNKGVNQMWMEELNELLEYMEKNKYMY